ncbi:MAG: methyl-accepting chemotaxis protein [Lachnospiraceae bacterium]|nr:methyl-accepting chemotaxis protein [Lachnospiraceae bacterium]
MKKHDGKLIRKVMVMSVGIAVVIALILTVMGIIKIKGTYLDMAEEELRVAAVQYESQITSTWDGDWAYENEDLSKGGVSVTEEYLELMTDLKADTNLEYTIFYGNTRVVTTLKDESGEYLVGTTASDKVVETVYRNGQDYMAENIVISGEKYYGYYVPLANDDGTMVGMVFSGRASADINRAIQDDMMQMLLVVFVAGAFMIGMAINLNRLLSKVMLDIEMYLEELAEGRLNAEIDEKLIGRNDELGGIADSAKRLRDKLHEVLGAVKEMAEALSNDGTNLASSAGQASEASGQVSLAVEEISKGAIGQAESVESASGDTSDMGEEIDGIDRDVTVLDQNTVDMTEFSNKAMEALNELLSENEQVVASMQVIDRQIRATNDAVRNIAEASGLISGIAAQTNLLALNASIEAARAGDAGRGFAVVATEIGSLADQSRQSTVEINNIVNELIEESQKSVETVEQLNQAFEEQNTKLSTTKEDMVQMTMGVDKVTQSADEIKNSIRQLNGAKNNLISIITDLSAISEENAASTQETNASMQELTSTFGMINHAAEDLQEMSASLTEQISFFTI